MLNDIFLRWFRLRFSSFLQHPVHFYWALSVISRITLLETLNVRWYQYNINFIVYLLYEVDLFLDSRDHLKDQSIVIRRFDTGGFLSYWSRDLFQRHKHTRSALFLRYIAHKFPPLRVHKALNPENVIYSSTILGIFCQRICNGVRMLVNVVIGLSW